MCTFASTAWTYMSDMSKVEAQRDSERQTGRSLRMAAIAWVLTPIYYFYQYALRSSPSVMMLQLSEAGGSTVGVCQSLACSITDMRRSAWWQVLPAISLDRGGFCQLLPPWLALGRCCLPKAGAGTATGIVNFLTLRFSALLGPVFGWIFERMSGGTGVMEK
jgi:hypothetical protein